MTAPTFVIRRMRSADTAFLFHSFLTSFRESNQSDGLPNTIYYGMFKAQFNEVLCHFTILVAHPEGEEDEIAGWLAHSGDVVAWIYTKKEPWRHMGVARQLWNAAGLGLEARALYASRWALALAKQKGLRIRMASFVDGTRLLMGSMPCR